jgi:hypothetical protein
MTGNESAHLVESFITEELGFSIIPAGVQRFHLHFLKDAKVADIEAYVQIRLADSTGTPIGPTLSTGKNYIEWNDSVTTVETLIDLTLPTTGIDPTNRMIANIYLDNKDSNSRTVQWHTEGTDDYSYVMTSVGVINGTSGSSGSSGSSGTSGLLSLIGSTNNGIITFDGSAPNATVESNLTFDGNTLRANANATTVPLIIASGSSTQDLVRITQTGTGNAFVVEDSANPDTTMFVINTIGNVGIGGNPSGGRLSVQESTNTAIYALSYGNDGITGQSVAGGYAGVKGQGPIGVYGLATSETGTMIAVQGFATEIEIGSGTYIAGYFGAFSTNGTNYSLRLLDGTEGVDKILTSVTADGHANWKSDIKVTSITASASSSNDLVRITQTGTGNAFVVEDSTNPDTTPFVISNSGNVGIGTASTSDKLSVSGNVTITGTMSGSNNKILTDTLIQAGLLYLSNNC